MGGTQWMPTLDSRARVVLWLAIVILVAGLSLAAIDSYQVGATGDDATYIILARSLIVSEHYGLINGPGTLEPERYPFGFPLVLSVPLRIVPDSLDALRVPSLIATIAVLGLLFWCWPPLSGNAPLSLGVVVVALLATSRLVIDHARKVMSEPVFTTFCVLALILAQRRADGKRGSLSLCLLSLALMMAVFTRTIGIVLVGVIFAYLFVRVGKRFWKDGALILTGMATFTAIVVVATPVELTDLVPTQYLRDTHATSLTALMSLAAAAPAPDAGPSVAGAPGAMAEKPAAALTDIARTSQFYALRGIRYTVMGFGGGGGEETLIAHLGQPALADAASVAVAACVLLGLARLLTRDPTLVAVWYTLAYLGALLLWRGQDPRLLYPVLPMLIWGLVSGAQTLAVGMQRLLRMRVADPVRRAVTSLAVGGWIALSFWASLRPDDSRWHVGDLPSRTRWLAAQPSAAVVMTESPATDFLYAAHPTVPYPPAGLASDINTLQVYAQARGVRYVLVAPDIVTPHTGFDAKYSGAAKRTLDQLSTLAEQGHAALVYSDRDSAVQVFELGPAS